MHLRTTADSIGSRIFISLISQIGKRIATTVKHMLAGSCKMDSDLINLFGSKHISEGVPAPNAGSFRSKAECQGLRGGSSK